MEKKTHLKTKSNTPDIGDKRLYLFIFLLITCASLLLFNINVQAKSKNQKFPLSDNQIKQNIDSKIVHTRQNNQKSLTNKYKNIAQSNKYNLDNPYIKLNPYHTSPLSALVDFKTTKPAKITYTVIGKSKNTSITNPVNTGFQTSHQVPVVGLYENYKNPVQLTINYKDGSQDFKTVYIKTKKIPKNINNVHQSNISTSNIHKNQMYLGKNNNQLTVFNRSGQPPYALDGDGNIRWYSTLSQHQILETWPNGHVIFQNRKNNQLKKYHNSFNDLNEADFLGRVYKEYHFILNHGKTTLNHHDLIRLPNGDLLTAGFDGSGKYKEDTIIQISHTTGKVVKVIDMKKILPKKFWSTYKPVKSKVGSTSKSAQHDWLHLNSLFYNKQNDSLLISSRNQDLTMELNYKTNSINWLYSGKKKADWPKKYQKYVLTPTKGTTITGGQHGLNLLSTADNGNIENTLLFDNNVNVTNGNSKTSKKYSQAVQYQINKKNKTIRQTWSYGKSLGKKDYSFVIGYAQRLANGNTLIDFGHTDNGKKTQVIEVTPNKKQVFNLVTQNSGFRAWKYRAYRIPFYSSNYIFDATK